MGKSSPSAPAAPDPAATAAAQTATNKETAIAQAALNRINQVTPQGSLTYSSTAAGPQYNTDAYNTAMKSYQNALNSYYSQPQQSNDRNNGNNGIRNYGTSNYGTSSLSAPVAPTLDQFKTNDTTIPQYTQTTTYSPEQQKLYELQTQAQTQLGQTANDQLSRLQTSLAQPISYEGAPALQSSTDQATQLKAEQALMDRLNPQLDRDRASLESRLANQGLALNSQAYNTAMDAANRQANDQRTQAALQSINLGNTTANQNNAARQQYIQEAASIRNQPLNEISALLSGSQVSAPQFSGVPQSQVATNTGYADATNLAYQGALANYNSQQNSNNSMLGGLFGLGSSALGGWGSNGFNAFWRK